MLIGTTVNALAIVLGSLSGLLLRHLTGLGSRTAPADGQPTVGERLQDIIMKGVALCVLYIGVDGMLEGDNTLVAILSMVFGAVIGELLDLDAKMQSLGQWLQRQVSGLFHGSDVNVSEGFVTACLLFCVGAMAIVGSLEDGLTGDHSTLFAKALLDGISSIVFASSIGVGVAFSAVAVFLYQGTIALLASFLSPLLGAEIITEMTCVGSILILALSLNMLGLTRIKVMNLVPACLMPILLMNLMGLVPGLA